MLCKTCSWFLHSLLCVAFHLPLRHQVDKYIPFLTRIFSWSRQLWTTASIYELILHDMYWNGVDITVEGTDQQWDEYSLFGQGQRIVICYALAQFACDCRKPGCECFFPAYNSVFMFLLLRHPYGLFVRHTATQLYNSSERWRIPYSSFR